MQTAYKSVLACNSVSWGGVGLRSLRLAHSIAYSHTVRLTEQAIVLCTNFCSKHIFHGRVISHYDIAYGNNSKLQATPSYTTRYKLHRTPPPNLPSLPVIIRLHTFCMPFVCLLYAYYMLFIYRA